MRGKRPNERVLLEMSVEDIEEGAKFRVQRQSNGSLLCHKLRCVR